MRVMIVSLLAGLSMAGTAMAAGETLEPGEEMPGGAATHTKAFNRDAFSHFSANMSFAKEMDFKVGNGFFRRLWVTAPSSTKAADGLGPLFNARACQNCHIKDGRGHPPESGEEGVSMFLRLSIPAQTDEQKAAIAQGRANIVPEPTYGGQLQNFAIAGHAAEGRMNIRYDQVPMTLGGGEKVSLRKPTYSISDLGYGPLHPDALLSPRVAPPMIGLGLLEAIAEETLLAQADPDDKDGDGISGRAKMIWSQEDGKLMLGRFGWKGGNPTVKQQSADAFNGDIGLSNPLFPANSGDCTSAQQACLDAPHGGDAQYGGFEVPANVLDLVSFYSRNLAVPKRRDAGNAEVLHGKQVFHESGCASCHTPTYKTAQRADLPEQSEQVIWPYTDLLLHDMGDGLADGRPEGMASGSEWKTPPLWGIGLTHVVNGHTQLLHDGRARSVLEAILWHGGEAQTARDKVVALPKADRAALLRFVNSL
ncbi:di-heme oxidoredictase family protein [Magnetospirillum sulfuroxidans]|uniref:C-type cytochrome n=1 Tax=Magnetospirillum sulfuroxidans TaxID=611300 RepID=A0ABS5I701_9PROT|nr:di-heme oxidoredictase family protein [Magnetospirillum sulfuroxidans]MBR9970099.1 c-type cytochrome [Magnetospirillum sulfuroxidans]